MAWVDSPTYPLASKRIGSAFGPLGSILRPLLKPYTSPISNIAALAAVTTAASAACHHTHAHCARVLSALPRRRITRYLGRATRHPSPRPALVPLTRRGCTRVGRPPAATVTLASRRALVPCPAPSTVVQARASSPYGSAVRTAAWSAPRCLCRSWALVLCVDSSVCAEPSRAKAPVSASP